MIQALKAILGAALTSGACLAAGALLIGRLGVKLRRAEQAPLAFVLGAACLHLAVFTILALHLAYTPVFVALLAGLIAAALLKRRTWRGVQGGAERAKALARRHFYPLWFVLFGAFTLLYFFHALGPESSPDGSSYHLGLVARYLRSRGFEPVYDFYAALSGGVEMIFTPAFAIGKHSAAALVHFAFLIALALAVFAYGKRLGKPWAGAAAAFLVYASPVVGIDGTSAYVDAATAAITFSVFYWIEIWDEVRDDRLLIPAGLLAGYAYAAKYTAFAIFFYAAGFVWWRRRSVRPALKMAALALPAALPWMLKNWIVFHNPVAPFASQLFRDPYFHVATIQELVDRFQRYGISNLWSLPLEVTVRGEKTQGVIGPAFLLAPVALFSLGLRVGRRLLAAAGLLLAAYLTNIGTHFLIPELPFLALALALAMENSPGLIACLAVFHAVTSWPAVVRHYAPDAWRLSGPLPYREALRIVPQDRYLRQVSPAYRLARLVEDRVPEGEKVLAFAPVADAYTSREVLSGFHSALNEDLSDMLNMGWADDFQPRVLQQWRFPERSVRKVRVELNGPGRPDEQWSIHELRFCRGGAELPRRPEWRLSARPDPWDVQLAFDNSPATRWRTWEKAAPGDYVEVDFGQAQTLDEVRLETSYDDHLLRPEVKISDEASGRWQAPGGDFHAGALIPDANIRRYATRELALRGVHYVLVADDFPGSSDFSGDTEGWGLELIAQVHGARLYRTVPAEEQQEK
jgi:hypothetical protein